MENKDTNTDYEKFVRIAEIKIEIIVLLHIRIHYFLYREFSSPTWKKSPPPSVPIPTQNPDVT